MDKQSFKAVIKLLDGELLHGELRYLPENHYLFLADNKIDYGFKFHRDEWTGYFVDAYNSEFLVFDDYMVQLYDQILANDLLKE